MTSAKKLDTVLVVEDNADHMECTQNALNEGEIAHCIVAIRDGEEALDYLYRQNGYSNPIFSPRPELILLDLKLPKVDGFGILAKVKSDPELKRIPVIILTSTINEDEIHRAISLGINDLIVKPFDLDVFVKKVIAMGVYWARVSDLA
jgi:CheY-like chemotaxis protein